jgi:predicted CxxxxCH...CXXCH cytochrome family protein
VQDEGDNFVNPTLNSYSVNLAPGASQNLTLGVTARTGKIAGREKATVTSAADAYHTAVNSATTTTNLNVATCTANTPQLVVGPDAGNVAVGGTLAYSVSIKNTDVGASCAGVTYAVAIVSENPATPNSDFNQSALTYQAQNNSTVNVLLNPGQTGTVTLTVSAKTPSTLGVQNVTTIGATALLHTPPANVTATTTVGNSLLHNSINIQSTKWSSVGGWGVPGGKYGEFICNTCHTLDGSTNNIKKVLESITTPDTSKGALPGDGQPIVFTKVSGNPGDSGVLGDDSGLLTTSPRTSSNKICEICHTYDNTGQNGVKVHAYNSAAYTVDTDGVTPTSSNHRNFNAKDCIVCHTHNAGFLPAGCDGCHGEPPTDATLANVSGKTTGSVTGGRHETHVTTYGFVCNNCHNGFTMPEDSTVNPGYYNISIGFSNFGSTTGTYSGQSNVSYSVNGAAQFLGDGTASCSTVYCHSNVQNDGGAAGTTYASPQWTAASVTCDSCHGQGNHTNGQPATGSHELHVTTGVLACSACHNNAGSGTASHSNRMIDMAINSTYGASAAYGTGSHAPGSTYAACSSVTCHGTSSPTWGANTTNDTCTKCHGTGTVTVSEANRYVVAPPKNMAGSSGTATGTGEVSDDAKVGAHQTHLQMLNGLSAFGTVDSRCQACHGTLPTSGTHANGSSEPAFEGLATKSGTMSPSYSSGSCNNTYCHNPAATGGTLASANAGTGTAPLWTNANYIADGTLKTTANCGVCHKSPWDAGFTSTFAHGTMTTATNCAGCHGHNGGTGGTSGQQHMDGIKYGAGSCNSCHDYDTRSGGTAWGVVTTQGGLLGTTAAFGAHAKHIEHLKARAVPQITSLDPNEVGAWGGTNFMKVCGVCHSANSGEHVSVNTRLINFNGSTTHRFGSSGPTYNYNTTNGTGTRSCSSLDCHFKDTPIWGQ